MFEMVVVVAAAVVAVRLDQCLLALPAGGAC
eukprot:COSAG02_NODE_8304_length_2623_cov_56.959984_2_plen_31_part_00